jgi:ribosomal protein L11 methylase PrmA
MKQRRRILNRLAPQGVLVLAGISRTQFQEVRDTFMAEGMRLISSRVGGEWRSGTFRRR